MLTSYLSLEHRDLHRFQLMVIGYTEHAIVHIDIKSQAQEP